MRYFILFYCRLVLQNYNRFWNNKKLQIRILEGNLKTVLMDRVYVLFYVLLRLRFHYFNIHLFHNVFVLDLEVVKHRYHCTRLNSGLIKTTLESYDPNVLLVESTPGGNIAAARSRLLGLNCSQWIKLVCNDSNPPTEIMWMNDISYVQYPNTIFHSQKVLFNSECSCMDARQPPRYAI